MITRKLKNRNVKAYKINNYIFIAERSGNYTYRVEVYKIHKSAEIEFIDLIKTFTLQSFNLKEDIENIQI